MHIVYYFFFRQIFCDFGKDFVVIDNDGETPVSCMISAVTQVIINILTDMMDYSK